MPRDILDAGGLELMPIISFLNWVGGNFPIRCCFHYPDLPRQNFTKI